LLLKDQLAWEKSPTSIAAPAAVSAYPGRIDLFVLGIDNQIYHGWGDGETWQGWENMGGPGMHGLAVAARGPQRLDLFTIGTDIQGADNHMYHRAMVDAQWGSWENLGGACISAPAAVAGGENQLDAFVVGTRSALFQKSWDGSANGLGVQSFGQAEKDAAKRALDSIRSPLFAPYKARAQALIDDPASLNQGPFGICGMATAVYFLLQYDLDKYVALVKSIFDGVPFNGIPVGMKEKPNESYSVLLFGRERKQIESMKNRVNKWQAPNRPVWDVDKDFDFIVSRSLGKLIKIHSPFVYQVQARFSEQFDPFFNYKENSNLIELFKVDLKTATALAQVTRNLNSGVVTADLAREIGLNEISVLSKTGYGIDLATYVITTLTRDQEWELKYKYSGDDKILSIKSMGTTLTFVIDLNKQFHPLKSDGDLALDVYGQVCLMKDVIGAQGVDFTYSLFRDSAATINATFDQKQKPFVLATINGYVEWCFARNDANFRTFDNPPTSEARVWGYSPLRFVHIIGVTGKIEDDGAYYKVPVWTWAEEFTVRIKKELLSAYIYGYVYGKL
jgi:hypothetical protein